MKFYILLIACLIFLTGCATTGYQPNYIISQDEELTISEN